MVMTVAEISTEVREWYTSILGTFVDEDDAYGAQCKDLISHYIRVVHQEPYTKGNGDQMADALIRQLGWPRVSVSSTWQVGDVVSVTTGAYGGHVFVVVSDDGTRISYVDLNGGPESAGAGPDEAVKLRSSSKAAWRVVAVARPPRYVGATTSAPAPTLTEAQVLSGAGGLSSDLILYNASALVRAAARAGIPLYLGAAMIRQESSGRNVFGNDAGGVFSTPNGPDIEVTPARYAEFYARAIQPKIDAGNNTAGETSNGVGPSQVTWWEFHRDAKAEGLDLADPEDNMFYGLRLFAGYLAGDYSEANVKLSATRYNRGGSATTVNQYGLSVWGYAQDYQAALSGATTDPGTPAPTPTPTPEPTPEPEPMVPPTPGISIISDPGPMPQLLAPSVTAVIALPDPEPGAPRIRPQVSVPVARFHFRGQVWSPLAMSIRRALQIPGPDQSPIGAPIMAATGEVTLARPVPLSDRGWSLWHDDPPRDGEPITMEISDDGCWTWTTKFVGTVRGVTAEITEQGIVVEVTDLSRRLAARFSHPPLNFRQPSPVDGYPYMRIGLHPVYYANLAARAARFYCTPPMVGDTTMVSAPMVGSMYPERGTITYSSTLNAKGMTEGVPEDSPEYRRTWWGLTVHNVFSVYRPVEVQRGAGRLTGAHGIRALVGPATDTISAVELWWGRVSITAMVTRSEVTVEVQSGWNADGTRKKLYTRSRPISAAQAAEGFELRVWLSPDGVIEMWADDSKTTHTAVPAWPVETTATDLSDVRILAPAAGAPLGGVQVVSDPTKGSFGPWDRGFLPDVDPDHMLWGGPALEDVRGLDLLAEMAEAALDTVWVDESGRLRYVSRARMDARPSVRTLTLPELVTAPARMTPDSVHSEVQVKRQQPSLFQTRLNSRAWTQVWEGPRDTLTPGGRWEQIVTVPDDEDWFHVDGAFEDVSTSSVADANRGIGSWVGGTWVEEGDDGTVEGAAPRSWFWGEAGRITHRSYRVVFGYAPPEGVTADLSLTVPEIPGLRARRVGTGPLMRARGKQTWAESDVVSIRTGAVMDDPTPYTHDGGRWVQSGLQARRIARRLAPMLAQPIPAWGPVRVGRPDLSLCLADTLTLEIYGMARPQRLAGEILEFNPDAGLVQDLTFRQLRP